MALQPCRQPARETMQPPAPLCHCTGVSGSPRRIMQGHAIAASRSQAHLVANGAGRITPAVAAFPLHRIRTIRPRAATVRVIALETQTMMNITPKRS